MGAGNDIGTQVWDQIGSRSESEVTAVGEVLPISLAASESQRVSQFDLMRRTGTGLPTGGRTQAPAGEG